MNHLDMCQQNGSWLTFLVGSDEEEGNQVVIKGTNKRDE